MAGLLTNRCPIIGGSLSTRMTKRSFEKSCALFQDEKMKGTGINRETFKHERCQLCKGNNIPSGIEYTDISAEVFLNKNKKVETLGIQNQECESCGREKPLANHYGKNVCAVCTGMRGSVRNRIDSVMAAVREFHDVTTLLTEAEIKKLIPTESYSNLLETVESLQVKLGKQEDHISKLEIELNEQERIILEQEHHLGQRGKFGQEVDSCSETDKSKLLTLAMDIAQASIEKKFTIKPEYFKALRMAATV